MVRALLFLKLCAFAFAVFSLQHNIALEQIDPEQCVHQQTQQQTHHQAPSESECSGMDMDADMDAGMYMGKHSSVSETTMALFRLPFSTDWQSVDKAELMNAIFNVGFMKLEMSEEAKRLAPEVDAQLKDFFKSIDHGLNLDPKFKFGKQWWPQKSTFYGYNHHYKNAMPLQNQIFYLPKGMINDTELNPFMNMTKVMRFFHIMFEESNRMFYEMWLRLGLFPIQDLRTIVNGRRIMNTDAVADTNTEAQTETETEAETETGSESETEPEPESVTAESESNYNYGVFEQSFNMTTLFGISMYNPDILTLSERDPELSKIEMGLAAHSDSGIFTVLKSGGKGFQILYDGKWMNVNDSDCNETFVVNFGRAMNLTTNGMFKAGVHRVLPIHRSTSRLSIALFNDPNMDGWIFRYNNESELEPYITGQQNVNDVLKEATGEDYS